MTGLITRIDGSVARWIHSSVEAEDERAAQGVVFRLLVLAVAALLCLFLPLVMIGFALPLAVAATAGAAALPLIVAAVLSATGSRRWTGAASLLLAAAAIAALSANSGGLASPFIGWLAFLPLAAAMAGRTWVWVASGVASAVAACGITMLTGSVAPIGADLVLAALLPVAGLAAYGLARLSVALECRLVERTEGGGTTQVAGDAVLDCLPGLITIHDLRGDVIAVHGTDCDTFGSWLDPMARGFFQQIHLADRIAFMQAIDAIRRGEPSAAVTLRMHAPSKDRQGERHFLIEGTLAPMAGTNGSLERILMQSRDVTETCAAKLDAEARIAAAESANAAKTRYLAAVSHELRTPLNAILGFSQTLTGEYFGGFESEKQRDYVTLIRQSGDHMLSVVNSLLDMSRIESGRYELRYETFDVDAAVRRCEAMLAGQAETKGVLLTRRVARDCGTVTADARAFDQILINLVANAVKFTEKDGIVSIDAERCGNRLRVSVSDTGIGIPAEHLDAIGEPFTRLCGVLGHQGEGSGLGLSLVKGLVALHDGGFSVRSVLGEGTVVTVELPREGRSAETLAAESQVIFPPQLTAADRKTTKEDVDGYDDATAQTA